MKLPIPPQCYEFSPEDIDFVLSKFRGLVEERAFLTMGKYGEEFEQAFAKYHQCQYAVAVNSGTAALEIILRTLDVAGSDVVVPTNTAAATVFAVIAAGGRPVFADCGADLIVDPKDVAGRLTAKTKAVITVHVGGLISPSTPELVQLCDAKGIYLVEDAAHAHGCMLDGKRAGTFGIAASFSFFSTKVMTTGEGGMVVTGERWLSEKAAMLRNYAKMPGKGNYHEEFGYNWRMGELPALLGLAQLRRLDDFINRRNHLAKIYDGMLRGVEGLTLLPAPPNARHNFYKYILFLDPHIDREQLQHRLKTVHGVNLSGYVWELPCHEQPVFSSLADSSLPVAEELCRRHVCLPVYYSLTDEEAVHVARSLLHCLDQPSCY